MGRQDATRTGRADATGASTESPAAQVPLESRSRRGDGIVRALDLAADLPGGPPRLQEPVYFVSPGLQSKWPELDGADAWVDPLHISPTRWGPAENIWIVSSYLKLKRFGLDVKIVDSLVPDAINVCFLDAVIRNPRSHECFIVVTQADRSYLNWGEFTLAQSPAQIRGERSCLIDHWPQPGLMPRRPDRGTEIRRIGYTGHPGNLAEPFHAESFRRELANIGVEFVVRGAPSEWHDYRDLDLHLAVRDGSRLWIDTKPATKLIHSWLAECPGLLGPEPSFQFCGEDGVDYVEVREPHDVLAAVVRLRRDPDLYRSMQLRGREKARGRDEQGVCRQWAAVLAGPVRREFESWRRDSDRKAFRRRLRRSWHRLAAPVSRKVFFLRAKPFDRTLRWVLRSR